MNEQLDELQYQSIHEIEPIVPDFIMEDVIEEICSVKPGVAVSFKVNLVTLREGLKENEATRNCLSLNVRKDFG